jgi:hypothetical protein
VVEVPVVEVLGLVAVGFGLGLGFGFGFGFGLAAVVAGALVAFAAVG